MINVNKIDKPGGSGYYMILRVPEVEFVDPIEHVSKSIYQTGVTLYTEVLLKSGLQLSKETLRDETLKRALQMLKTEMNLIFKATIPVNLLSILKTTKKNTQIKLLKGLSLTQEQLYGFIFKAKLEYDYSFSTYTAENLPKGIDPKSLPEFINANDGKLETVGKTNLTDGQIKQVMDQRNCVSAIILDKGNTWHCFFLTINSAKGKEAWKDGQAHYHYISDKFGLSRLKVVEELKSGRYHLGNLPHIDLIDDRYDNNKGKRNFSRLSTKGKEKFD